MIVSQIIFSDEITQNIKNKKPEDDIIKVRYRKEADEWRIFCLSQML